MQKLVSGAAKWAPQASSPLKHRFYSTACLRAADSKSCFVRTNMSLGHAAFQRIVYAGTVNHNLRRPVLYSASFASAMPARYGSNDRPVAVPPSKTEVAIATPSGYRLVRLFSRLFKLLDDWVLEPLLTLQRLAHILLLFVPIVLSSPAILLGNRVADEEDERTGTLWWYDFLSTQMERAGPTFIKLAQWIASRTDLFPLALCTRLSKLHSQVDPHPFSYTKRVIEDAFGKDISEVFSELDQTPLGVGAIAQVYKAKVRPESLSHQDLEAFVLKDNTVTPDCVQVFGPDGPVLVHTAVAIKVIHPKARQIVHRDLKIMHFFATALALIPSFHWLSLPEEVAVFGNMMCDQLDLRVEADNLRRFNEYFSHSDKVKFPKPLANFATKDMLLEEYEHGIPLRAFLDQASLAKKNGDPSTIFGHRIANIGLDVFLHMLIFYNFVHADLHPGNIMVKFYKPSAHHPVQRAWSKLVGHELKDYGDRAVQRILAVHDNPEKMQQELEALDNEGYSPHLVFLDTGLVNELNDVNRRNFLDLFRSIAQFDGYKAGELMVERCRTPDLVIQPDVFALRMQNLILGLKENTFHLGAVKIGNLLHEVLNMVRAHHVKLEGDFVNVIVSIMLLEGIGRQLDPDLDLFKNALPVLREYSIKDRGHATIEGMKDVKQHPLTPHWIKVAPVGCNLATENDRLLGIIEKQKIIIQDLQKALAKATADRDTPVDKSRDNLERESPGFNGSTQCSLDCSPPPSLRIPQSEGETIMLCPVPPPRSPYRQQKESPASVEPSPPPSAGPLSSAAESSPDLPAHASLVKDDKLSAQDWEELQKKPLRPMRSRNSISGPARKKEVAEKRRPIYNLEAVSRSSQEEDEDETDQRRRVKHLLRRVSSHPQLLFTAPQPPPQEPPITSGLSVKVIASNNTTNLKGKAVASFTISVRRNDNELWRIEKLYSDFLKLDNKLKLQNRSVVSKMGKLPDKALFTTHAPYKVDQRKMDVEKYLQHAIQLPVADNTDIRNFLNSDRVDLEARRARLPGHKDGYLTKRGKNFGGWKARYFVLDGPVLKYYESRDGPFLGSIYIPDTQIGPQHPPNTVPDSTNGDTNHFRHAFMILEPKKSAPNMVHRHILCADSDDERDEWLEALSQYVCDVIFRKDNRFRPRKVSKDEIKPIAAVPMAQLDAKLSHVNSMTYYPQRSNSDTTLQPFDYPFFDPTHHEERSLRQRSSMDQSYLRHHHQQHGMPPGRASLSQASSDSLSYPTSPLLKDSEDDMEDPKKTKKVNRRTFWAKKIFTSSTDPHSTCAANSFRNFLSRSSSDATEPVRPKPYMAVSPQLSSQVPTQAPNQVFGVSLDKAILVSKISDKYELPAIVWRCIEYLEAKHATQEEGIYRLSGSAVKIRALKQEFNEKGDVDLLASGEYHDIHAIAGLLKMWLRELPNNVLTHDLLKEFLPVIDLIDRRERVNELGRLVSMLPIANYTLLRTLTAHLIRVVQNSETNKMTVRNVGIVFSPTLGIPAGIFSLFLSEFDYIFWTNDEAVNTSPDDQAYPPLESSPLSPSSPPPEDLESLHPTQPAPLVGRRRVHHIISDGRSNRNSVHYMDGAPQSIVNLEKGLEGKKNLF
ncbi:hypothetical protein DFQ29_007995 [Apophysomyces sp. BC1021]|nr:hypothetical protein DFQ29_007995 [Apophysomyces sp. BC1021]